MKFYTVYTNPTRPYELQIVPQGFSWLVFIVGSFGLLLQKNWIFGLPIFGLCCLLYIWVHPAFSVILLIHFFLACFAYSLQRKELLLSGWNLKTVIAGQNKKFARLRLLDQHPELKHKLCV